MATYLATIARRLIPPGPCCALKLTPSISLAVVPEHPKALIKPDERSRPPKKMLHL